MQFLPPLIFLHTFLILVFLIFIISLIFFYYAGIFLGFFVFGTYGIFISILIFILNFRKLRLKWKTNRIQKSIYILEQEIYQIEHSLKKFSEGKIQNISHLMKKKFKRIYKQIRRILKLSTSLENMTNNSRYKNFIYFSIFSKYLQKKYNQPIQDMISLLQKTEKDISQQMKKIEGVESERVDQKKIHLEMLYTQVLENKEKMKGFLLS